MRRAGQWFRRAIQGRISLGASSPLVQEHSRRSGRITTRPKQIYQPRPQLVYPRLQRHSGPSEKKLRAGLLDIRSVCNKSKNVPDLIAEYRLNVLVLTETWHENPDSVAVKKLRSRVLGVIEQARFISDQPRLDNVYFTNHGDIAIVSERGTCFAKLHIKLNPKPL